MWMLYPQKKTLSNPKQTLSKPWASPKETLNQPQKDPKQI